MQHSFLLLFFIKIFVLVVNIIDLEYKTQDKLIFSL